jgi:hypothetical protein
MQQFLFLLPAQNPLVGEQQKFTQPVESLTLVELRLDPSPIVLAFQVAQDDDGLDQAAVLLQEPG